MLRTNRALRWVACLTIVGAFYGGAFRAEGEVADRILATVDKEVILLSDVMLELGPVVQEVRRSERDPVMANRILQSHIDAALQQAIDERILLREAKLAGMEVSDDLIDRQLEDLIKRYPSREAFNLDLRRSGETMGDLRDRLRRQLLARRMALLMSDEFAKGVTVSEAEVTEYFAEHPDEFSHPERLRIRQIFLAAPEDNEERRAEAKAKLEELRGRIAEGADFAELAKIHSQAPGAEDGGIVGWIVRGDLLPELEGAAFSLDEGGVSPVVATRLGMHLIMVDDHDSAGAVPLAEARTLIEPRIRAQKAQERYETWMKGLRKTSKVRVFNR